MSKFEYKHIELHHPKNEVGVFNDLVQKYEKFGTLYVGVDFDNTLLPYGSANFFDEDGLLCVEQGFLDIVELLRKCKELDFKLCLWSLPTSQENLDWKIEWCKRYGIEMDYINESPLLNEYSKEFNKPHFNLLLDDVAGLESSFSILYNICKYIESKKL